MHAGFFLKELCFRQIPHQGRQVTVKQVIAEFSQGFDPNHKCQTAIARLMATCCLKNQPIDGQPVSPDAVADAYPDNYEGKLGLARFRQECCLKKMPIHGQPVSAESIVAGYQAINAVLELGRFKAECCLKPIHLNGQPVMTEEVVKHFQDADARLELIRFQGDCCLKGLTLHGKSVAPERVVRGFEALNARLNLAHFKASCVLEEVPLDGKPVPPETVVKEFQTVGARLSLAHFMASCCIEGIKLNGQLISVQSVLDTFPPGPEGKLGRARFMESCHREGISLNHQPVTVESVVESFRAVGAMLELARFKHACCVKYLSLNGQLISPEEVADNYRRAGAPLELARFKSTCCLNSLNLDGHPVTPETVADSFRAIGATRELVRFRQSCCLNNLKLDGKLVTPESVIDGLQRHQEERTAIAHFKACCCLEGRRIHNQPITPEEVISSFSRVQAGKLNLARFLESCCLRGLPVQGKQVPPESVMKTYLLNRASTVSLAHFKAQCCLKGLRLNRQQLITPTAVISSFPSSVNGLLSAAIFKESCCLRGLKLDGQPVAPEAVIDSFPDNFQGRLAKGRFLEVCCLRGIPVDGQPVTQEAVMAALERSSSQQAIACFKAECCLRDLILHGQPVSTDEVIASYPPGDRDQKIHFRKKCCLNGLNIHGQPVTPEQLVQAYEQDNRLLEKAVFYSELALRMKKLHGSYLTCDQVLAAFNQLPEDHSVRKVEFLSQRLIALLHSNEEAQSLFEQAWQIIDNVPIKNERHHYQRCLLLFMAMDFALPLRQRPVSPEQVWQSIRGLRESFTNTRLRFYFLAHCVNTNIPLHGQPVTHQKAMACLHQLPVSKLRYALERWFEQVCRQSDTLARAETSPVALVSAGRQPRPVDVYIDDLASPAPHSCQVVEYVKETPVPGIDPSLINARTRKVLDIIHGIGNLRVTGSFSRCLQGIATTFNDIDLIGTEEAVTSLIARLPAQLSASEDDVPCHAFTEALPGCPQLELPPAFNITLIEGDLGHKLLVLQASVYTPQMLTALASTEVHIGDNPVTCLPFLAEVRLMINALQYLIDHLDPLTTQLQAGKDFDIPRTVLFNFPRHPRERIFGLLMRCLLSLKKARQFCTLLAHGEFTDQDNLSQKLTTQVGLLQTKVQNHVCGEPFFTALNQWLASSDHNSFPGSAYHEKKRAFIRTLLI